MIKKALKWLELNQPNYAPVAVVRDGYAQFVACVYKIKRKDKPDLWFVFDTKQRTKQRTIRRICKP